MSKRVLNKMQGAFQSLGIELKESHTFYEFEYEHIQMLLSMEVKDQSFVFLTYVVDSNEISMDKNILEMALDVVGGFHKNYYGDWNDGIPYFSSPCYSLRGVKEVKADWLEKELKAFFDAYMFLEANIRILCDPSIFGLAQEGVIENSVMNRKSVEKMILKDFIAEPGLIGIDAGDIKAIREDCDFMDGQRVVCYAKEMKECLQTAIDDMNKAHSDAKLTHLAVKLLLNKESEMMLDEMSSLGEIFDKQKGVEAVWGIGKNDSPQDGKIAICVVGGVKNN